MGEFTEVESGKRSDRPELEKALTACRKHKAKLVIAKLDRLSRNVHFISGLMERKVDFVACDMPSANAFMINVYAAVAQEERRMISDRTKAGLAAAKARGVKLGGPRLPAINEMCLDALERARVNCADSLGIDGHVGPCRGCRVECAPSRNAKRRTVVCQDRHPCARAADIDCALGAGPGGHPLPDTDRRNGGCQSTDVSNPFLGFCFGGCNGLRWKLQHRCFLTLQQVSQQHHSSVGKF